jgi:hypothetical protein
MLTFTSLCLLTPLSSNTTAFPKLYAIFMAHGSYPFEQSLSQTSRTPCQRVLSGSSTRNYILETTKVCSLLLVKLNDAQRSLP